MIHALLEMFVNKTICRTEADIELIIDDEHISRWVIFTKWCEYHRRRKIYLFPLFLSSKSEPPPSPSTFVFLTCVVLSLSLLPQLPSPSSNTNTNTNESQIRIQSQKNTNTTTLKSLPWCHQLVHIPGWC